MMAFRFALSIISARHWARALVFLVFWEWSIPRGVEFVNRKTPDVEGSVLCDFTVLAPWLFFAPCFQWRLGAFFRYVNLLDSLTRWVSWPVHRWAPRLVFHFFWERSCVVIFRAQHLWVANKRPFLIILFPRTLIPNMLEGYWLCWLSYRACYGLL